MHARKKMCRLPTYCYLLQFYAKIQQFGARCVAGHQKVANRIATQIARLTRKTTFTIHIVTHALQIFGLK